MTSELHDLKLLLESEIPLLVIESHEEPRVLELLTRLAIESASALYTWSVTEGLGRAGFGQNPDPEQDSTDPTQLLQQIKDSTSGGLYVLCDFHPYLQDEPVRVRLLKEIAMAYQANRTHVILLSDQISLPPELKRYSARFELAMPSESQLLNIVREEASRWSKKQGGRPVKSSSQTFRQLVNNLKGVSLQDARQLARGAIYDDGAIDESDLDQVNKAKFTLMDMEGVLSFEYDTTRFEEVGGLVKLKEWLDQRHTSFMDQSDLDPPKGILLLGVQGGGKSLAAKAVAGKWQLPLLRLDFGTLYNKYFGETEKNLREALKLADLMSPCVLWLDEIEKGISTEQNDQGISQRILGTLLTWMAERTSQVFMVATANDIARLPPELIRKGRMDEIFFVDLPQHDIRIEIFAIHLHKRQLQPDQFNLEELAAMTDGFSGAEIEQIIVSALYSSAAVDERVAQIHLVHAIQNTHPLSMVMAEKISYLRDWANDRCVFAD